MQTRVIAGQNKGTKLENPASGTRPLTDRIKTSLFDLIRDFIKDADVLDLYAGGGNFGIEALSRGANYAVFVDLARDSIRSINTNLDKTKLEERAQVVQKQVEDYVRQTDRSFDVIMTDPPFNNVIVEHIRDAAKILKDDGILIFRHPLNIQPPQNLGQLTLTYSKKYGISILSFYQKA